MPPIYGPGALPPAAVDPPKTPKDFKVYHDASIPLWSQWDVPTALSALDNHSLGQFYQSALLADAMGIDDAYDAVVNTRILGLISRPFCLVPSRRGDGRKAKLACRILTDRWDEIFPEDVLSQLMRSYLEMGFSPAQPIWRYDEKLLIPQIQIWHPSTLYFDIPTRHYVANTMEGPAYIRPGDGKWILLTPWGSYRGWMRGAVRACVIPFLARQYALRDWARYNEVHGMPIKLAKMPARATADDKQTFTNAIANLGNESVVGLPQGVGDADGSESFDLSLLEAKADTHDSFMNLISKCEERIAIRMLGQNLTTNIDGGSFAAANVHDRVRLDYTRFDAKAMGVLADQVLRAFCQFNFGDADLAPDMRWDTSPPEDKASRAKSLSDFGVALQSFKSVGVPYDTVRLAASYDIPLLPGDVPSKTGQIFKYHVDAGIVTVNEVRHSLGLPLVEGGDVPTKPPAAPEAGGGDEDTSRLASCGAGCIIAPGKKDPDGYGRKSYKGVDMSAHQAAWLESGKKIPAGKELDHTCNTRSCINVGHLELVTHAENVKRIKKRSKAKAKKASREAVMAALAAKLSAPPPPEPKPIELTFAQRNAAFLADLKDMRDLDIVPDVEDLAKKHGVPAPKKLDG